MVDVRVLNCNLITCVMKYLKCTNEFFNLDISLDC